MTLSKPPEKMTIDELRQARATLLRWVAIEGNPRKLGSLRVELNAVDNELRRRKRR